MFHKPRCTNNNYYVMLSASGLASNIGIPCLLIGLDLKFLVNDHRKYFMIKVSEQLLNEIIRRWLCFN